MDLQLKHKVALVMAGSKGLGRACAETLATEGAHVCICARNKEELEKTASSIREKTGNSQEIMPMVTDLTHADQVEAMISAAATHFGTIDILVNNAGGPPFGPFSSFQDADWQRAFDLNLMSMVRCSRLSVPYMRKSGSGRIINIISMSVNTFLEGSVLSTAMRMAVKGTAKMLAQELGPHGITVNNVAPGSILTDRLKDTMLRNPQAEISYEEKLASLASTIPVRRLGTPQELAALVAFLASPLSGYISGATIPIDGGVSKNIS